MNCKPSFQQHSTVSERTEGERQKRLKKASDVPRWEKIEPRGLTFSRGYQRVFSLSLSLSLYTYFLPFSVSFEGVSKSIEGAFRALSLFPLSLSLILFHILQDSFQMCHRVGRENQNPSHFWEEICIRICSHTQVSISFLASCKCLTTWY